MNNDFAIQPASMPQVGQVSTRPRYLITFEASGVGKIKSPRHFIAMDKPDLQNGFIAVKGIYIADKTEEEIVSTFTELLSQSSKEMILDLMLPTHRIHSIRSLIFNANKPSSLLNK